MTKPSPEIRQRIARCGDLSSPDTPLPMLTLEEFFTGNDDPGSICCNLPDAPPPSKIFAVLQRVRERSDVDGVYVEVKEIEDDEYDMWPFSDTVWVITTAPPSEIVEVLGDQIQPDEVLEGWDAASRREVVPVPTGYRAVGLWWD